ncbi:MAG TPA: hypothetical protein DEQ84_00070 [Prevotellaceae bacterium]|nr:hypothetical protein [Prevotellaceae bacterium]
MSFIVFIYHPQSYCKPFAIKPVCLAKKQVCTTLFKVFFHVCQLSRRHSQPCRQDSLRPASDLLRQK